MAISPLELFDALEQESLKRENKVREKQAQTLANDRVRNSLGLRGSSEPLTESQKALSTQFRRVMGGERLSKKTGAGFFSIPTGGRQKR